MREKMKEVAYRDAMPREQVSREAREMRSYISSEGDERHAGKKRGLKD
jgi:hypothetical protein